MRLCSLSDIGNVLAPCTGSLPKVSPFRGPWGLGTPYLRADIVQAASSHPRLGGEHQCPHTPGAGGLGHVHR